MGQGRHKDAELAALLTMIDQATGWFEVAKQSSSHR